MKKGLSVLTAMTFVLVLFTGSALAYPFGKDITILDEAGSGSGWHGVQENDEIEPGSAEGQEWDLEAMYLKDDVMTMVMGYDFMNGEAGAGQTWKAGDIYFDLDGTVHNGTSDAEFGDGAHAPGIDLGDDNGNKTVQYNWGYDLVFDIDWDAGFTSKSDNLWEFSYDVYTLDQFSQNISGYFRSNDESGAWRYVAPDGLSDTDEVETETNYLGRGVGTYLTGLGDDEGLTGGVHNAVSVNLNGFLGDPTTFVSHFTMQCGNDNLMGDPASSAVPEPSTIILLGFGILGLVGFRKKLIK